MFRTLRGAVLSAAMCAASLAAAGPAIASPVSTGPGASPGCIGTACLTVSGKAPELQVGPGGTVQFDYGITVPDGVTVTSFAAHDDRQLVADSSTVQLDGAALPAGAVDVVSSDLTISAAAFSALIAGTHHVTFAAKATSNAAGTITSWAEAAIAATAPPSGTPPETARATSADVPVQVTPRPVNLALQGVVTTPEPIIIGRLGGQLSIGMNVANTIDQATPAVLSVSSAAAAAVTISVNTAPQSACGLAATPATYACPVGTIQPEGISSVSVSVRIRGGSIGATFAIALSVAPTTGTDSVPSDNTVSLTGTWSGMVHLHTDISPGPDYDGYHPPRQVQSVRLPVGTSQRFAITVANIGPDAAPAAKLSVVLLTDAGQFQVSWPSDLPSSAAGPTFAHIPLGDLPAGGRRSVTVTVKSVGRLATATLGAVTTANADIVHPTCAAAAGCDYDTVVHLAVIAPPSSPSSSSSAVTSTVSSPITAHIADTGAPTVQLGLLAAAGLGLGVLLLGLTRRRTGTTRNRR